MVEKYIVIGSVKAIIGMILLVGGLAMLNFIYWDWPVEFYVTLPSCIIGALLVLWGAYDIKYGERHAAGWNIETIAPSNNMEMPRDEV